MTTIAVVPGDGIGPEVVEQAMRTIEALELDIAFDVLDHVNAKRFLDTGTALSDEDFDRIKGSDAALLGAVGDPRITSPEYARGILLRLRFELDLYVNLRPVKLLDSRLSPLQDERRRRIDCLLVRENTEGLYAGVGGVLRAGSRDETALDVDVNTFLGVSRVIEFAFSVARRSVCVVDKSNAVRFGGALWQRCWRDRQAAHPDIGARHLYVDTAAMQFVADPSQFDVVVTNNSYGDILSDLAAQLGGGLGTAPSANLNPGTGFGLYEPVHGSAPDIAGTGEANPVGAILSAALLLDRLGRHAESQRVCDAVGRAVCAGRCTADIGGTLGTGAAGDAILAELG